MNILTGIKARDNVRFYVALMVSTFFLLIPALYNHYPIMDPDTATHIASGFKLETPMDRPITYGLLIWLFSINGCSLWPVVFMQAYMMAWLLLKIIKALAGNAPYLIKSLAIIFFLSIGSGLSWTVCQLQPDFFTSAGFLCIILLLLDKEHKKTTILLYALFFVAVAAHMSHPLLFCMALISLLVFKRIFTGKEQYREVNRKIITLILLAAVSISIMGPALSKSKHIFFTGSLLEKGVLKKYLDDNCATKKYKLCAYKDNLPAKSDDFIWDPNSPIYKIGDWSGTKKEFSDIIHNILTTPAYLKLFIIVTTQGTLKQIITYNACDGNFAFPPGSNVNQTMTKYLPGEINAFNNDRQNTSSLWNAMIIPNIIFTVVIILSLLAMMAAFIRDKQLSKELQLMLIVCFIGIVLNSFDCAAFSMVLGRYGCKMIWLVPFCAMVWISSVAKQRKVHLA